jgi:hypothetical protein
VRCFIRARRGINVSFVYKELPARTFLEGFYWRCDFSLVGGTILHDYLDGQQQ